MPVMYTALFGSPSTKSAMFSKPPSSGGCFGSASLPRRSITSPSIGASSAASKTTGIRFMLGCIGWAVIVTPGIKFCGNQLERPAEIGARGQDERSVAIAARHDDRLPRLRIAIDARNADLERRLDRRQLDAIHVRRPALAQMVGDAKIVVAVLRHLPSGGSCPGRGHRRCPANDGLVRLVDIDDRIDRRADSPGVAFDFPNLPLLGGELEEIDVARLSPIGR